MIGILSRRYWHLVWEFFKKEIKERSKGSYLGVLWLVLQPLSMLMLYILVFGYIYKGSFSNGVNETRFLHGIGIFIGLNIFRYISDGLASGVVIIKKNAHLIKKVVIPLDVLPLVESLSSLFVFILSMGLVFVGLLFAGHVNPIGAGVFVLYLPVMVILVTGLMYFISVVSTFLEDINQLVGFMTMGLLFSSAVFYSTNDIPAGIFAYLKYNPVLCIVSDVRDALLWGEWSLGWNFYYSITVSIALFTVGVWLFQKTKKFFIDVL